MGKTKLYKPISSMSFNAKKGDGDLINLFNDIGKRRKQICTKAAIRETLVDMKDVILDYMDRRYQQSKAS